MDEDFREISPSLDDITKWCLSEIVYCLAKYHDMSREEAYRLVVTDEYLRSVLEDDPIFLQHSSGFDSAMLIMRKGFWWHNETLQSQYREYIREERKPPSELIGKE